MLCPCQMTIMAMIADLNETADQCSLRARRLHEPADNARLLEAAAGTMTRAAEMLGKFAAEPEIG